jgi:kinesin family protein 5
MKVENMVKLKEEFDYKSLCRKLEVDLDRLMAENERQAKALSDIEEEMQRRIDEAQLVAEEAQKDLREAMEV